MGIDIDGERTHAIEKLYDRMGELSDEEDADDALLEKRGKDRVAIVLEYEIPPKEDEK